MKVILEEKDLMAIVEAHVATNPFFNLKGKEVSVDLNVTEDGYVEVAVDINESGSTQKTDTPVKRTRRSSAEVKAAQEAAELADKTKAEEHSAKVDVAKADAQKEIDAKAPPFEPTVVAAVPEEDEPRPVASKSLFA